MVTRHTQRAFLLSRKKSSEICVVEDQKTNQGSLEGRQKNQLPPVIETGTLGCLACAAIPRSTTELKKLV